MGDRFSNRLVPGTHEEQTYGMNNGETVNSMRYLSLAAAELAETDWERAFAVFLGERLTITAGFDLADIAWSRAAFDAQRAFLLRVVERARTTAVDGGAPDDFYVATERVLGAFDALVRMLRSFEPHLVAEDARGEFTLSDAPPFRRCHEHRVYYAYGGCPIARWCVESLN